MKKPARAKRTKRASPVRRKRAARETRASPDAEAGLPLNARARSLAPSKVDITKTAVAAEGAFAGSVFQNDVFQVGQRGAGEGGVSAAAEVVPPVSPTLYPQDLGGTITVHNHITVDVRSDNYREFAETLDQLLEEMRRSNAIGGEVRDKLVAEIKAGKTLIEAPKPDRGLIHRLLIVPLKYIALMAAGAVIGKLAGEALDLLMALI